MVDIAGVGEGDLGPRRRSRQAESDILAGDIAKADGVDVIGMGTGPEDFILCGAGVDEPVDDTTPRRE